MNNNEVTTNSINSVSAIENGWRFLETQNDNGFFKCYIGLSQNFAENFQSPPETSNMLIADVLLKYHPKSKLTTDTIGYLNKQSKHGLFTYFEDRDLYPPDSDVNAIGYSILFETSSFTSPEEINRILTTLLSNTNSDGIVQVWISHDSRQKQIDHVVATNIMYLAHLLGRSVEIEPSKNWVHQVLESNEYLNGSRYYNSPSAFLFALSRVASRFDSFRQDFQGQLYTSVAKRVGAEDRPINIAMVIMAAKSLGINTEEDQEKLLRMQNEDGSWPADALFRFGSKERYFGSRALTTAYAIRALEVCHTQTRTNT